jgi:MFS family permease
VTTPWRTVVGFGVLSLAADLVYEGARSIYGPLLGLLGASALVVGLVTGAGEAMALLLRLVSGSLADRTGRYWALTIAGYALTAICVPLLAVTPLLSAGGLALATVLILAERAGKAVRSPAKSALLATAAGQVGLGRGFAVHKALDQIGAFAGPLVVAGIIAATGLIWPALAVLAIPGALAMGLLLGLRSAAAPGPVPVIAVQPSRLSGRFHLFAASAGAATAGLVTFGLISFHAAHSGLLPLAAVPLIYAGAMAAGAVAALASGWLYDRWQARVLYALPVLGAAVPPLAFAGSVGAIVVGALLWGAAVGVQDSTVKALVADLVPAPRRATAYGVFAAVQGVAALGGGALAGALYERSRAGLIVAVVVLQLIALVLLAATRRSETVRPTG